MTTQATEIQVKFELQVGPIDYLPEFEFGENATKAKEIAARVEAPYGHLVVEAMDHSPLVFGDDLLPMASNLYGALCDLKRDGKATLMGFSQPFVWRIAHHADTITITADQTPPINFAANELLEAMSACYQRMVAALKVFTPQDPDWAQKVDRLKPL